MDDNNQTLPVPDSISGPRPANGTPVGAAMQPVSPAYHPAAGPAPANPSAAPIAAPASSTPSTATAAHDTDHMDADDDIWIERTKRAIAETQNDPYRQVQLLQHLNKLYLKERFGREVQADKV